MLQFEGFKLLYMTSKVVPCKNNMLMVDWLVSNVNVMTETIKYLKKEVILQHSLHRHHQQIPQGELSIVCSLRTLLKDESKLFQTLTRILISDSGLCTTADVHLVADSPNTENCNCTGPGPAAGPRKVQLHAHLQLHADVLSLLAELIQGADGRLHVTAVFPVDQQP